MSNMDLFQCPVCCQQVPSTNRKEIFAIGPCHHPICYECSTKMRVLCSQIDCPICRQKVIKVVFTPNKDYVFNEDKVIMKGVNHCNKEHNIYFDGKDDDEVKMVLESFESLLEFRCPVCKTKESSMKALDKHVRTTHEKFFCDICMEHLKVFCHERKTYSRKDLTRHRRLGDADDKSHRGHPICEFCDTRFLDDEVLHLHLRREHYHCTICDPLGLNKFYNSYAELKEHYREKHHVCEEGRCRNEEMVFRDQIDLQAHRATYHCTTKRETQEARLLSLEFGFEPTRSGNTYFGGLTANFTHGINGRGGGRGGHSGRRGPGMREEEEPAEEVGAVGPLVQEVPRAEDFPTLGADASSKMTSKGVSGGKGFSDVGKEFQDVTVKANAHKQKIRKPNTTFSSAMGSQRPMGDRTDDDFPSLPFASVGPTPTSKQLKSFTASVVGAVPRVVSKVANATCLPSSSSMSSCGSNQTKSMSTQSLISYPQMPATSTLPSDNGSSSGNRAPRLNEFPSLPVTSSKRQRGKQQQQPQGNGMVNSGFAAAAAAAASSAPVQVTSKKSLPTATVTSSGSSNTSGSKKPVTSSSSSKGHRVAPMHNNLDSGPDFPALEHYTSLGSSRPSTVVMTQSYTSPSNHNINRPLNESVKAMSLVSDNDFPGLGGGGKKMNMAPSQPSVAIQRPQPGNNQRQEKKKKSPPPPPGGKAPSLSAVANLLSSPGTVGSPSSSTRSNHNSRKDVNGNHRSDSVTIEEASHGRSIDRPSETNNYLNPPDFENRNTLLLGKVKDLLKEEDGKLAQFIQESKDFKGGRSSSDQYYQEIHRLLGPTGFQSIFHELISLLPNVQRQKDLLQVHLTNLKLNKGSGHHHRSHQSASSSRRPSGEWHLTPDSSDPNLVVCPTCTQVLVKKDGPSHMILHLR